MKKVILAFIAVAALVGTQAEAAVIHYTTVLSGAAESPPNDSLGTGIADVLYDDVAHTLAIDAAFSGLTGTTTVAHIHCCTLPTAGVAVTPGTLPGFPAGVTAGTYAVTLDLTLNDTYTPGFRGLLTAAEAEAKLAAGLAAGQAYFNVHSSFRPGGEIRGFLQVPEPTSLSLVGLGIAGAILLRRRRRS